jgi:PAS domain S-box-containing protein/putative nucleotidyltransferase with HDIG domain
VPINIRGKISSSPVVSDRRIRILGEKLLDDVSESQPGTHPSTASDTSSHNTIAALRERNVFLQNILDSSSSISIISTDLEGNVLYWNAGAENIFGYRAEEIVGRRKIDVLYPPEDDAVRELVEAARAIVVSRKKGTRCEIREVAKDGRILWISMTLTPRFDEKDRLIGILGIGEDITQRKHAEEELRRTLDKVETTLEGVIRAMTVTVETRDPYTAGHQRAVADLARAIARGMELPEERVEAIHIAGVIHDLGKIAVPAEILSKPGELSSIQMGMIRTHPEIGYEIVKNIEFPWPVAEIILQHHERLDGSGYPQGLSGDRILLEARILAVADVVEAMASHRPYRPSLGIERALDEIRDKRGTHFDPAVVDVCLGLFREKGYVFPRRNGALSADG